MLNRLIRHLKSRMTVRNWTCAASSMLAGVGFGWVDDRFLHLSINVALCGGGALGFVAWLATECVLNRRMYGTALRCVRRVLRREPVEGKAQEAGSAR